MVATQQWYVGPGQQNESMLHGYDQKYEDRLFESIRWPSDGYRLFDIGHFIGERDWFDGLWESNCMFVPRKILEQIGGMDESFTMPGGEYANLDLYERVASAPDVVLVSLLGEGSFHQLHGGTTTNEEDVDARKRPTRRISTALCRNCGGASCVAPGSRFITLAVSAIRHVEPGPVG